MLYGSETWCSKKHEVAISINSTRSMVRAMCHVKLLDKRNTEKLMLGLKKATDKLARANGVRWYGHVLKIFDVMKAMVHEMDGKRKQGRPGMKWREEIEVSMRRIGLRQEDVADRCRWREGVKRVAQVVRCIRPPPVTGDKPD